MEETFMYVFFLLLTMVGSLLHQYKRKDVENTVGHYLGAAFTGFVAGLLMIGMGLAVLGDFAVMIVPALAVGWSSDSLVKEYLMRKGKMPSLPDVYNL